MALTNGLLNSCLLGALMLIAGIAQPQAAQRAQQALLATCDQNLASFSDASGCEFGGESFTDLKLSYTLLDSADFSGAELLASHTRIAGARPDPVEEDNTDPSSFHPSFTERTIWRNVHAQNIDFSGARLEDVLIEESDLIGADFRGASIISSGLVVDGEMVGGAALSSSNLNRSDFTDATMDEVNLFKCNCTSAAFVRASLRRALLFRATLRPATSLMPISPRLLWLVPTSSSRALSVRGWMAP